MKRPLLQDDAFLADVAATPGGSHDSFRLRWLGQSGFLLQWRRSHLLFDPYLSDSLTRKYADTDRPHVRLSERVVAPERLTFIDVVTVSHAHTDHCDPETLRPLLAANPGMAMIAPRAIRNIVEQRTGALHAITMIDGSEVRCRDFQFFALPSAHNDLDTDEDGHHKYLGYLVRFGRWTIYHSGDTKLYASLADRLRPFHIDMALLPINGDHPERRVAGNMSGGEAAQLAKDIGAKIVIPCHYDMFEFNTADPSDEFIPECERLGQPYRVLQQGERFSSTEIPRMKKWKVAGVNFDHMHMGDNLRMAFSHSDAEIVGICDEQPQRMAKAAENFHIPPDRVFTDYGACLERTQPDLVILCPATAHHGEWVEKVAPFGVHLLVEKPFAASLAEADRMTAAVARTGKLLAINWPLAWYPSHRTAKRLIDEGRIGDVLEVHYYDGNRGPLYHAADKVEITPDQVAREKPHSWWYKRANGGGSLLDYLGYGTTLGTWYHNGEAPVEVTCVVDQPEGLEVDEQSVTIARYRRGLSKFETRWGTFTDPWTLQPQPKCGFVIVGTDGTISSYDYESTIHVQTRQHPEGETVAVDELRPPFQNPIQYMLDCIEQNRPVEGPLSPAISRIGQQIVDSAVFSARERRTVPLVQ